jgi:hypothetical protein
VVGWPPHTAHPQRPPQVPVGKPLVDPEEAAKLLRRADRPKPAQDDVAIAAPAPCSPLDYLLLYPCGATHPLAGGYKVVYKPPAILRRGLRSVQCYIPSLRLRSARAARAAGNLHGTLGNWPAGSNTGPVCVMPGRLRDASHALPADWDAACCAFENSARLRVETVSRLTTDVGLSNPSSVAALQIPQHVHELSSILSHNAVAFDVRLQIAHSRLTVAALTLLSNACQDVTGQTDLRDDALDASMRLTADVCQYTKHLTDAAFPHALRRRIERSGKFALPRIPSQVASRLGSQAAWQGALQSLRSLRAALREEDAAAAEAAAAAAAGAGQEEGDAATGANSVGGDEPLDGAAEDGVGDDGAAGRKRRRDEDS